MTALQPADRDLSALVQVVLDTLPSPHSRRAYGVQLREYLQWTRTSTTPPGRRSVQEYVAHLTAAQKRPATVNLALSAIKKLYSEAAENGWVDDGMAAAVERIPGQRRLGQHAGNWLDVPEMHRLLALPDTSTVGGRRDSAVLHLLYAGGLRRSEVVGLRIRHLQRREGRLCLVDLEGKGKRVRTVPLPEWAEKPLLWWRDYRKLVDHAGENDAYLTSLHGDSLSDRSVYEFVQKYREMAGIEGRVSPHDLRRTSAKHQRAGGAPIEQISAVLGHASVATTELYLGTALDLENAACDFLPKPVVAK